MKRLLTTALTIMLMTVAGNAFSQFVDPNRNGISDEILRVDHSADSKPSTVIQQKTTEKKKQQAVDREPKFEIANDFSDKMKIEYVEVSRNKETGRFELVLSCTNRLSSRSVYITRATAEGRATGVIKMETICFQAPQNKAVEVVIPLIGDLDNENTITIDFSLPFMGYGVVKVVNAPIKWL